MANIKSQKKRIEVGENNRQYNFARKNEVRTAVKTVEAAVAAKKKDEAVKALPAAISGLDKLAQDGIISANSCARKKAHLQHEIALLK
jgi:small subunit ribosomal protein S20